MDDAFVVKVVHGVEDCPDKIGSIPVTEEGKIIDERGNE